MLKYGKALYNVIIINYPKFTEMADLFMPFFDCMDRHQLSYQDLKKLGIPFRVLESHFFANDLTIVKMLEMYFKGEIYEADDFFKIISELKFYRMYEERLELNTKLETLDVVIDDAYSKLLLNIKFC